MSGRSGWAFGERIPEDSPYLTILGSAWTAPTLHGTEEESRAALAASPASRSPHLRLVVAHVTEGWHGGVSGSGHVYKISGQS
jgi:hypothetical protein